VEGQTPVVFEKIPRLREEREREMAFSSSSSSSSSSARTAFYRPGTEKVAVEVEGF
jgi:hypothetical protein